MPMKECHLVTGGGGYPGYHLGKRLAELGRDVVLLDIRPPLWPLLDRMKFVQVRLCIIYDELIELIFFIKQYSCAEVKSAVKLWLPELLVRTTCSSTFLGVPDYEVFNLRNVVFVRKQKLTMAIPFQPKGMWLSYYTCVLNLKLLHFLMRRLFCCYKIFWPCDFDLEVMADFLLKILILTLLYFHIFKLLRFISINYSWNVACLSFHNTCFVKCTINCPKCHLLITVLVFCPKYILIYEFSRSLSETGT